MNKRILGYFAVIAAGLASCISEQVKPKVDCSLNPLEISLVESSDVQCGSSDGAFTVLASGGEPPYVYEAQSNSSADGNFSSFAAGTYSVTVTDSRGCTSEVSVSIENLGGVNVNQVQVSEAGCGSNNGTIQVSASGGEEPFKYSLNGGSLQGSNVFSSLGRGSYSVSVVDQAGCETTETVQILSGVSYNNSIKTIIANNCAVSGCHNGSISPDLRTFSTIQARASSIKSRTGNKSMPKGSSLSDEQIELIACWVNDGAQNN